MDPDPAFHLNADPDPVFHSDADSDPVIPSSAGQVMGTCDNWSVDPQGLHFEPPGLYSTGLPLF